MPAVHHPELLARRSFLRRLRTMVIGWTLLAAMGPLMSVEASADPAPTTTTSIVGRIFDQASGAALAGAMIEVEGTGQTASTAFDGSFTLSGFAPGSYGVTVSRTGYQPVRITAFPVGGADPALLETSLQPEAPPTAAPAADGDRGVVKLEAYRVVEAKTLAGSRESFTALRRATAVPVDTLSSQDLSKLVATDVSDAIIHLPGVSISTRGAFAVIRGLSERYNATTLNGIVMPSSDPDRQSVELDQFPTRLIDGLVVYKAFSPELPGNVTGGGIDVKTVTFPSKRILSVTVGVGIDEGVFSGTDYLTYDTKGSGDRWGFGARDRVTQDDVIRAQEGKKGSGKLLPDPALPFTTKAEKMPLGQKFALFYADTFRFRQDWKLGVSLGVSYDVSYGTEEGRVGEGFAFDAGLKDGVLQPIFKIAGASGRLVPRSQYSYQESSEQVLLGVLGNLSLRMGPLHQINFTAFSTQTGVDSAEYRFDMVEVDGGPSTPEAIAVHGTQPAETAERFQYDLRYRERNLTSLVASGRHSWRFLNDGRFAWSLAANSAYQDEPDTRHYIALRPYNEVQYEIRSNTTDAESALNRTWRKIEEDQRVADSSLRLPFDLFWMRNVFVEAGGTAAKTDRDYREILTATGTTSPSGILVLEQPGDLSPFVVTSLVYAPSTVNLKRDIDALFAKVDLPLTSWLKFAGGVRREHTELTSVGFGMVPGSPLSSVLHYVSGGNHTRYFSDIPITSTDETPENRALFSPHIDQDDVLPAASLAINPLEVLTLRLGYAQTIARPSLREVGNYYSKDEEDRFQHGNGLLQLSEVRNYDFRAEYFFGGTDLVALSVFYKEIDRPIEKIAMGFPTSSGTPVDSWINNPNTAELRGAEFEWRKNLGFLGGPLAGLTLGGNATYIEAEVAPIVILGAGGSGYTEKPVNLPYAAKRRLYDQPRWLANADLTYEVKSWGTSTTLSYFASDRVLSQVQADFDRYRDAYSRLDLTISQRLGKRLGLKLSAKNLLNPERRSIRDPEQTGGVEIVDRRFHEGRAYSVTVTADF